MDSRDGPAASEAGVGVRVLLPDGGQMEEPEQEADGARGGEQPEGEETGESEAEESGEEAESDQQDQDEEALDESDDDAEEAVEEVDEGDEDAEETAEDGEQAEDESSDDAETAEDETDADAAEGDEEGEEESEREKAVSDEGARLLHLNVDGVFLDLLGLEVDLDTVTLDLTAVTGESKLLGNLLSAVSGLLGGEPLGDLLPENPLSGLFGGEEGEDGEGSMLPDFSPMERARELAASIADAIRSAIDEAGSSIVSALPLEELLAEFLQALVDQLLESADGDGGDSGEAEEAAASA